MTHRPGKSHGNSDALSGKVCQRQEQNESKDTNHNPDQHNEETMSINMTAVELSRAVTRGQQQSDSLLSSSQVNFCLRTGNLLTYIKISYPSQL